MSKQINQLTGSKIKGADYEGKLIYWIIEDPDVSNLKLSKLLKSENIQVSSATIGAWRKNYFSENTELIDIVREAQVKKSLNLDAFEKSLANKVHNTIDKYQDYALALERRINLLQQLQEFTRKVTDPDTKKEKTIVTVNLELERTLLGYWKTLDTIRARAHKFTGGAEYVQHLQDLVTEVATAAIRVFFPHIPEAQKDNVKNEFKHVINEIESHIYDSLPEDLTKPSNFS